MGDGQPIIVLPMRSRPAPRSKAETSMRFRSSFRTLFGMAVPPRHELHGSPCCRDRRDNANESFVICKIFRFRCNKGWTPCRITGAVIAGAAQVRTYPGVNAFVREAADATH